MLCSQCYKEKKKEEFQPSHWVDYVFIKKCKSCISEYQKKYNKNNKEKINKKARKYHKKKYNNDPEYKIKCLLRGKIRRAVKKEYKKTNSSKLLGCTIVEVKKHLEEQFEEGMTWDNHGEWHIDHIRPCASFDLTDPEQQKECFNYKNLQPLWAEDNLKKGKTYVKTDNKQTTKDKETNKTNNRRDSK